MKQLQRLLYLFGLIILITLPALAQRDVYDAPIIIQPFNNAKITALQPQFMVFIWTATGPAGFGTTRYRFEMVDMTENNLANPEDAFRSKAVRLYYVEDNLLSPNLLYNLSKPPLQQGHKYAVRVIASDDEFQPTFRNGGISPVIVFTYGKTPDETAAEEKKKEPQSQGNGELLNPELPKP